MKPRAPRPRLRVGSAIVNAVCAGVARVEWTDLGTIIVWSCQRLSGRRGLIYFERWPAHSPIVFYADNDNAARGRAGKSVMSDQLVRIFGPFVCDANQGSQS